MIFFQVGHNFIKDWFDVPPKGVIKTMFLIGDEFYVFDLVICFLNINFIITSTPSKMLHDVFIVIELAH